MKSAEHYLKNLTKAKEAKGGTNLTCHVLEEKYDGHRVVMEVAGDGVRMLTRTGKDIWPQVCERLSDVDTLRAYRISCVLDCEPLSQSTDPPVS